MQRTCVQIINGGPAAEPIHVVTARRGRGGVVSPPAHTIPLYCIYAYVCVGGEYITTIVSCVCIWTALLSVVGVLLYSDTERDQHTPALCFGLGSVCANSGFFFFTLPPLYNKVVFIHYIILLRWSPRRPTVNDGDKKCKKKNDRKTKSLCWENVTVTWRRAYGVCIYHVILYYCIRLILN